MIYGNKREWIKKEISSRLNQEVAGKIKGYYCWRLATVGENYAHVFISEFKTKEELEDNWENIVNQIAFFVQSEQESLLERSNFYIWFFVEEKITTNLQKYIENDTYSSQKFVISGKETLSLEEQLNLIQNKLFAFQFDVEKSSKMMISKVELENFRTYKGKKIIDFEKEDGTARLVVLYAPNGKGKTSFFDAIEWNLTGNIDRFKKIANKSICGEILRNTEADKSENASVCIYFNDGECLKRNVSRLNNQTKKDNGVGTISIYPKNELKEYVGKSDKWKNLILQHHKIDGFIAATKPQALYEEWGSLWDPNGEKRSRFEDSYRKKRNAEKELLKINETYVEIKQKSNSLDKGRTFAEKLEENVKLFRKLTEKDTLGNLNFQVISAEEYVEWSNQVDRELDWYRKEKEETNELIQYIHTRLELDNEQYQSILCWQRENLEIQKQINEKLQCCYRKKQLMLQKKDLIEKKEQLCQQEEMYQILKMQGKQWYEQARKYFDLKDSQQLSQESLANMMEENISLEQKRDRLHIEYCKKEKSINDELEYQRLCSHLEELNALRQQCKELNEQIQECVSDREIINNEILEVEETIHKFKDKKLDSFDDVLRAYDIGLLDIRESNENLNGKRQKLCDSIFCYVSQKKLLERINQNIIEEEKVEEEVQHILLEARKIIEQRKSRVCPVCNTSFQSSHELMENTYRTVSLKGENLKKMREKQEVLLDKSKDYCLKNLEEYQIVIDEIVVEVENKKQQIKKKYEEKSMQEGYLCILLKEKQEKIERIQLEDQEQGLYVIYTKEGIESWYALWKAKQEAELLELKSRLELSKNQVQLCYEIQNELKQSIKNSQETMLRIANEMKDTFSVLRKSENLIKKYSYFEINQHVIETEKEREELLQKLEMLEEELCNYQEILLSMEESYEKEKEDLEKSFQVKEEKASELLERIHNVFQNMEINDLNITKEQIKKKEEELNSENLKRENVIELLENLKYNNEIENYFTEWKKTNQLFRDTEKKKDKQEVVVENAQKAYQCAVRTIQQEMQEFLRQFQVSDIYEKLEPHEELKTLIGEFDFNDDGKPELSFQVSDKTGKKYSPEWYFSTAQLNVVAFSVFLGRALKTETEPIKSILIDDPVGHFDDMNIVGFVNLLQNIIENTDRQLIISTHEERVFGLIQRKIPEKEYPVKYIDFRKEI